MAEFNIILKRIFSNSEETIGVLYYCPPVTIPKPVIWHYLCFTLEDEYRAKKVFGETRIPAGKYPLKLRTEGTYHNKMLERFPRLHRGMIWVDSVPGFQFILIHPGNDEKDTAGCILPGEEPRRYRLNDKELRWKIINSTEAYLGIYPFILKGIMQNPDSAFIQVINEYSEPIIGR